MTTPDSLRRGRSAFAQQAWSDAYVQIAAADREARLDPADLERLATAAFLAGHDIESEKAWVRAHQAYRDAAEVERAARCLFWLGIRLLLRGERARAGGWLARAGRLLDDAGRDCVERGYLLLPSALQGIFSGDLERASAALSHASEVGAEFGDPDLVAFARHGQGRVLLRAGKVGEGMSLLDEVMASLESGEVSPMMAGDIYCSVIEACQECFDVRRAQEWTSALSRWCESQADLVPYRGQCLVRHAELLQLHGDWPESMVEAQQACEWLMRPPPRRAVGAAFYQLGEIHRLKGAFSEAEEAYRQAGDWGRRPDPGLALLCLAQGQPDAAAAAIRRSADEAQDPRTRSRLLPAYVEIALATEDLAAARGAADELAEIAEDLGASLLRASASQMQGAVLLAEGDARSALSLARRAWTIWQEIGAPYEAARARVLVGLACRKLGDAATAEMEFKAARDVFQQLGAEPDLARVAELSSQTVSRPAPGLTRRELQVLRLVASGKTNGAIAADLFISERTVERHVSNILGKLGLSSRSAATAYAYEHSLM